MRWGKSFALPPETILEAAGTCFFTVMSRGKVMMRHWIMFVKNLVKCSLDNYVLPGTLTGTEILWLYIVQWRRDLTFMIAGVFYLVEARCEFPKLERVLPNYRNINRSTE